jgi:hypothetical protein
MAKFKMKFEVTIDVTDKNFIATYGEPDDKDEFRQNIKAILVDFVKSELTFAGESFDGMEIKDLECDRFFESKK